MVTVSVYINGRDLEAEWTPGLRVLIREPGVLDVAYSLSEAFAALLPHGPGYVIRSTVDEAMPELLRKHARPN